MTTLSVQPLELGPQLQKINFGSEHFGLEGYANCPDVFVDNNVIDKENIPCGGGSNNSLAGNSVSAARFVYSLEYMGNEADPQRNLTAILTELYRICCDGALIEIHCANPHSVCRVADPFKQRSITENTWLFFDRQARQNCKNADSGLKWAQDDRMVMALEALDRTNINFKLLRTQLVLEQNFLKEVQAGKYPSQAEIKKEIQARPQLVTTYIYYLVCIKDASHKFALTNLTPYPPYVMRVYEQESDDIYISHALTTIGVWEPNESYLVLNTVRNLLEAKRYAQGMRVANIGANIGWYTLLLANTFAQVKVDAFEPTPRTLEILQQNVQINGLTGQVSIYPCALSQEAGKSDLFLNEHNAGGNALAITVKNEFDRKHKVTIKTETMDRVYGSRPQSEWPDFIIIDTEGHEQMVWNGAKEMFAAGWRPVVLSEFCPQFMKLRGACTYYTEWLEQYHYQAFAIIHQDNRAAISPMSLDALNQSYEQLKNNTKGMFMDILYVPDYMHLRGDKFVVDEA